MKFLIGIYLILSFLGLYSQEGVIKLDDSLIRILSENEKIKEEVIIKKDHSNNIYVLLDRNIPGIDKQKIIIVNDKLKIYIRPMKIIFMDTIEKWLEIKSFHIDKNKVIVHTKINYEELDFSTKFLNSRFIIIKKQRNWVVKKVKHTYE